MSYWGLYYKGFEVVWPVEWNRVVDALNDLTNELLLLIPVANGLITVNAGMYKTIFPWSGIEIDIGFPIPLKYRAFHFFIHVYANNLNDKAYAIVRKNQQETDLRITINPSAVGYMSVSGTGVDYNEGDKIGFAIDTTSATSGSLSFYSMGVVLRRIL